MAPSNPSNIRVSVHFSRPAVFAGEEIECIITFTNIASAHAQDPRSAGADDITPLAERRRRISPYARVAQAHSRRNSQVTVNGPNNSRRPSLALSNSTVVGINPGQDRSDDRRGRSTHGRSLSILSIGSEAHKPFSGRNHLAATRNNVLSHSRSSSVQSTQPRGHPNSRRLANLPSPMNTATSPLSPSFPNDSDQSYFPQPARDRQSVQRKRSANADQLGGVLQQDFQFPRGTVAQDAVSGTKTPISLQRQPSAKLFASRPPEEPPPNQDFSSNPLSRLISAASISGTPRSSMDLYSISNHSSETLASEYVPQRMLNRMLPQINTHSRQSSRPLNAMPLGPESLMMGYAQITGTFTVDGSLVNQAPFEEVKRKNALGGHGSGGVVGMEWSKRDSGLFGSLGWSSIGESLNGFLGSNEPSSIKDTRASTNSRNIPLISTPPSILFVDLKLAPGETRRYRYSFTMPKGLPPSHKGRAMKVTYHVSIGIQRPSLKGLKDQQVKSHEVPFRVLGSVDNQGEILGHDLMTPYNILRDMAKTSSISEGDQSTKKLAESDRPDFLDYVEALLAVPIESGTTGLLSPTGTLPPAMRRKSSVGMEEPRTAKEAIDFAILRSNQRGPREDGQDLGNRFEIARSGLHVATITLARPAYRLGEAVTLAIDLRNSRTGQSADINTYAIQIALESSEKVDPALALRSAASIYRYTRKVHAYAVENTLFAQRVCLTLPIPSNATPEFLTSGITLDWKIRVEFTTPRSQQFSSLARAAAAEQALKNGIRLDVVEQVHQDENCAIYQGMEVLKVETFEVSIPVKIYGAAGSGHGEGAGDVDGLIV